MLERAREVAARDPASPLAAMPVTRQSLLDAWHERDPMAREIVLASAIPLGRVLGAVIGTLGARDLVLVGPMTDFGEDWLAAVIAETRRSALGLLVERSHIHIGSTGEDVVELGAAAMVMTAELGLALAA